MFRILVFCIALFSICFGAYENELANFDKNFIASKNDAQVKFHHQLKSLYIQSVINEDEKTKIEILKEESGRPTANIENLGIKDIETMDLSISHLQDYAVASFTVIFKN